ncbi:hypothetical protein BCR42DRAFT_411443 [Absidia repens]|uniref:SET domain-containing protein n=1 Tax=Absidia repens TaxID=90262 RepID=A0A1X2ILQ5_9FUNG|nr:hypothetical protein BCR42DRAFT_411443 [Absidia repens]
MDCWKKLCPTHIYAFNSNGVRRDGNSTKISPILKSDHYNVNHTNDEGDFAVAEHKIPGGSLIVQEYPYVFQIHDTHRKRVCPGCLSSLDGIKPPTTCRQSSCNWKLGYCSSRCETRHWFSVHMYVCPFREYFARNQHLLLAFQMWIRFITAQERMASKISATTKPVTTDVLRLNTLVDNLDQHSEADLQRYKQDAVFLSQLFSFSVYDTKDLVEQLVRYQAVIRCNGFGIQRRMTANHSSRRDSEDRPVLDVKMDTVATSIYILASKFNHSCQPNVLALFIGTQLQLRAIRPILPGQPLYISYGPLAANSPLLKRQEQLLEHYFFECHCQACQVVPDPRLPPTIDQIYRCPHCKYNRVCSMAPACPQCENSIDWNNIRRVERTIRMHQDGEEWDKVLELQLGIYHNKALLVGKTYDQLALQRYMSHRLLDACQYCEQSVQIVRFVYGESSPEAAEEMYKFCGIAIES